MRSEPDRAFRPMDRSAWPPLAGSARLVILTVLLAIVPSTVNAAPFRPDILAALRTEGKLAAVVEADRNARDRGLDTPAATAQGWLTRQPGDRVIPDRQAVVILVDFSDNPANQTAYPPSHYDGMLFSVNSYPGGSMRDWYLENSYGQFNVTGVTTVWLRMPQTYAYYVDGQAGFGTYPHNAQKLAEDAVAAADPIVDFSQFDNDGPDGIPDSGDDDGVVDALFVVHAGPGREATGSNDDIHSHAWNMVNPPAVDGVIANGYSIEPEDGKRGVFGHEFGHVLGLPDLYDTDYSSSGVGDWCMMSYGSWGGGGLTPVHFLSWCKARLGFLDPTTPLVNRTPTSILRVETNPQAYKLWTGGYPIAQYFMVENRQRVGSDVSLPGDGLIITHIDETVDGNSDETHPLVAIEQADGQFHLEHGQGSDPGDPWPGSTVHRSFTNTSTPNSRDYAGAPTQVAVRSISNSAATMTGDLEVENQPIYVIDGWTATALGGNGDGDIDPGEQWDTAVTVRNQGLPATAVSGTASSTSPSVTVITGTSSFGSIGAEATAVGTPPFRFSLATSATDDAVPISIVVDDPGGHPASQVIIVGVNDSLGVFGWTHGNASPGRLDQWHVGTERNHTPGGSYAWKCGAVGAGNYADHNDAALYTIPLPLATVDAVRFWHWISAEAGPGNTVWDGAVIEASVDGGPWSALTPNGGYPCTIIPNPDSPFPPNMPCYGGSVDWNQARFDLSGLSGTTARIRFRFGSDASATAEGWYIDDVTIEGDIPSGVDPVAPHQPAVFLGQPRPNPARGAVSLEFAAPADREARVSVFDLGGRRLYTRTIPASTGAIGILSWAGTATDGSRLPSGIYFLALEAGGTSRVQRVQLVR
jgi:immune inhibitor A